MEALRPPNGEIMKDESTKGLWRRLWTPMKSRLLLGIPIGAVIALLLGIAMVVIFNQAMHMTNSNQFCYSCHVGMDTIVEEYEQSTHFSNKKGVQADCADCHVPKEFLAKMWVKIRATKDVYHMLVGTVNLDNFEQLRNQQAEAVWHTFQTRKSQECKSCHNPQRWNLAKQPLRAQEKHNPDDWLRDNQSCIDCHQGVAHKRPVIK